MILCYSLKRVQNYNHLLKLRNILVKVVDFSIQIDASKTYINQTCWFITKMCFTAAFALSILTGKRKPADHMQIFTYIYFDFCAHLFCRNKRPKELK